jgi:hypothetical protein
VPGEARPEGDVDAAEDELAPGFEPVDVIAETYLMHREAPPRFSGRPGW